MRKSRWHALILNDKVDLFDFSTAKPAGVAIVVGFTKTEARLQLSDGKDLFVPRNKDGKLRNGQGYYFSIQKRKW